MRGQDPRLGLGEVFQQRQAGALSTQAPGRHRRATWALLLPLTPTPLLWGGLLTSGAASTMLAFLSARLLPDGLDGIFWRKSEILSTKNSRSFRLANRKVILLLVLIDRGLGRTLEQSAFSTMVT